MSRRVRRRYGLATVYVLSDRIRLLRCRDGPLPPWACGYGYSLYGGPGSCKGEGAGWALNCVFRIAYCVRAGETATIQLFDWPAASRFQTGLTLEAFLGRLKGLTGRRDAREIARDDERMCEIGQEILGATGQTGGWRRPRASRRGPGEYGPRWRAFGGGWRGCTGMSARTRDGREFTRVHERLGKKVFGASRQTGGCGQLAAGPAAAVAAGVDWRLTVNEHNRAKGVLARRMRGDDELAARESYKIICYSSEDTCGKRLQANEKSVRWRRISSRFAGLLAFSSSSISSS